MKHLLCRFLGHGKTEEWILLCATDTHAAVCKRCHTVIRTYNYYPTEDCATSHKKEFYADHNLY